MGKSKRKHEYSSDSNESSEEEERSKKHKKHKKKSKKSKHKKRTRKSSSSSNSDNWIEKNQEQKVLSEGLKEQQSATASRDDWMTSSENFLLPTFTSEKAEKKSIAEKSKTHEIYDPVTSTRELNPYYKTGEGGLPSFQKPKEDDDYTNNSKTLNYLSSKQNWKRNKVEDNKVYKSRSRSPIEKLSEKEVTSEISFSHSDFLTDQQMNSMGAKMLKAEMMGNLKLAAELKEKLDKAREYRKSNKVQQPQKSNDDKQRLLTLQTSSGMSRPISYEDSKDSRRHDKKNKNKRVETHQGGERTRYYPDDDRFDIKQLFEREKFTDGKDQDIEFAKAISKVKDSQKMDMADIFSDSIRKDKEKKSDEREEAIREAQKMEKILDSCNKCFDSPKMNKDLVVHVGKHIYLAIPSREPLVNHHLTISSIQHVSCCTMIDEEVWEELSNLKKALTRFFFTKNEDVVCFETVKYLNRRPHMEIQLLSSKEFEMIQFYFKKAIQESEILTINKKLVDIKGDKTIRSCIPRSLPYFWIDFPDNSGMAHVIENQETFPSNFAQEIIGNMLNLDVNRWRKPRKEQQPAKRVQYYSNLLKNVFENL